MVQRALHWPSTQRLATWDPGWGHIVHAAGALLLFLFKAARSKLAPVTGAVVTPLTAVQVHSMSE